ncbi:MAG TPA: amino acid permease [Candidatus Saccharicenans sp.]|jgi:APA family basic amino acid/polyamine antiporter|nr:amino acid permease [Candidatus Saccharicenans sp.]HRD01723.1 amino acid permease [Candidatus Saccharicenans sp.]
MKTKFSGWTAVALVMANMVGTGVFTSLGFQVVSLSSGLAIILLWVLGGVLALTGALTYAEAAVRWPRCGGEYHLLSTMFSGPIGFLAGWVSILVTFAAPVAASAMAFAAYFQRATGEKFLASMNGWLPSLNTTKFLALAVVIIFTVIHAMNKVFGGRIQIVFTLIDISVIAFLIFIGLRHAQPGLVSFALDDRAIKDILSPAFAISMYFVTYSYSGWNAAIYIAGEVKRPERNLPFSLITGTSLVIVIYVLLNYVFLRNIPLSVMAGKVEVGHLFGSAIFGQQGGAIMSAIISLLLLASISSMILTGPRVSMTVGEDYHYFRWLARLNSKEVPYLAVLMQGLISVVYILTSSFEKMIIFTGFTLNLFTFLTVLGVMKRRQTQPEVTLPYRTWGYPVTPVIFLAFQAWILIYGLIYRPKESLAGIVLTLTGLIFYYLSPRSSGKESALEKTGS